jgi:hypothetical protein
MVVRLYLLTLARACFSATLSAHDTATASTAVIDSAKVAPLEPEKSPSA